MNPKPSFKREIFVKGRYLVCEQIDSTIKPGANCFTENDYLLMFHPSIGSFVAKMGMGTWVMYDATELFNDLKKINLESKNI